MQAFFPKAFLPVSFSASFSNDDIYFSTVNNQTTEHCGIKQENFVFQFKPVAKFQKRKRWGSVLVNQPKFFICWAHKDKLP